MRRKLLLTLLLAAFSTLGLGLGGGVAQAETCSTTAGPLAPKYHRDSTPYKFYNQDLQQTLYWGISCGFSPQPTISSIEILDQLQRPDNGAYDNGFGYQLYSGLSGYKFSLYTNDVAPNGWLWTTHGQTAPGMCDGVPHWYSQQVWYKVHFSDGSTFGYTASPVSAGLYTAC